MRPDADALVDAPAIAAVLRIHQGTLRSWASRYPDLLPRRGRDHRGRTLYRYGDVCAVVEQMRHRGSAA